MNLNIFNNYEIVIFDCDGVIIDSNLFKCEAFGMSVMEYPTDTVKRFVDHCKKTFGVSRYVKFNEFFDKFANEPFQESKYQLFLERYANYCTKLYHEADITPGAERLLSSLVSSGHRLFIASGSDEKELIEVFKSRNLIDYFNAIYGSPKKKSECIHNILNSNPNLKAIFIGDAISDLNASKDHNIDFIYMEKFSVQSIEQDEICRSEAKLVISTLEDLI